MATSLRFKQASLTFTNINKGNFLHINSGFLTQEHAKEMMEQLIAEANEFVDDTLSLKNQGISRKVRFTFKRTTRSSTVYSTSSEGKYGVVFVFCEDARFAKVFEDMGFDEEYTLEESLDAFTTLLERHHHPLPALTESLEDNVNNYYEAYAAMCEERYPDEWIDSFETIKIAFRPVPLDLLAEVEETKLVSGRQQVCCYKPDELTLRLYGRKEYRTQVSANPYAIVEEMPEPVMLGDKQLTQQVRIKNAGGDLLFALDGVVARQEGDTVIIDQHSFLTLEMIRDIVSPYVYTGSEVILTEESAKDPGLRLVHVSFLKSPYKGLEYEENARYALLMMRWMALPVPEAPGALTVVTTGLSRLKLSPPRTQRTLCSGNPHGSGYRPRKQSNASTSSAPFRAESAQPQRGKPQKPQSTTTADGWTTKA